MNIEEIRKKITPILDQHNIQYAGVFGSVARGTALPDSDIDILVKFKGPATFAGYLNLDENLKSAMGQDIDLVTEGGLNKFLRPIVEQELKLIYGQR